MGGSANGPVLEVGNANVEWDALLLRGTHGETLEIPYQNIVMWTLHQEENCLDLTLDGQFSSQDRAIEWWTGSVLELRCCVSSGDAAVALAEALKAVCTRKAQEK